MKVALDLKEKEVEELKGKYTFKCIEYGNKTQNKHRYVAPKYKE